VNNLRAQQESISMAMEIIIMKTVVQNFVALLMLALGVYLYSAGGLYSKVAPYFLAALVIVLSLWARRCVPALVSHLSVTAWALIRSVFQGVVVLCVGATIFRAFTHQDAGDVLVPGCCALAFWVVIYKQRAGQRAVTT
jgi:hypothetical protein